jgi:hypothetical protein
MDGMERVCIWVMGTGMVATWGIIATVGIVVMGMVAIEGIVVMAGILAVTGMVTCCTGAVAGLMCHALSFTCVVALVSCFRLMSARVRAPTFGRNKMGA